MVRPIRQWPAGVRARFRQDDIIDWLFSLLWLAVGALITVFVYDHFFDNDEGAWEAISYANPALIITPEGLSPEVPGLPAPSLDVSSGAIPVEFIRLVDCVTYECPSGSISTSFSTSIARLNLSGQGNDVEPVVVDIAAQLDEGVSYVVGEKRSRSLAFEVPIPTLLADRVCSEGTEVWRVQGVVTPLVPGGVPAAWVTQPIHVTCGGSE